MTVRTLRHFHQIGLLDEPERSSNGYRSYTVQHLATVLRIVAFSRLGLPLQEIGRVLDDTDAALDVLERLDEQAAAEIDRLQARRRAVASLRSRRAAPDLPLALVPYASLLQPPGPGTRRDGVHEREQLALLHRFTGEAGVPWLVEALDNLSRTAARYAAVVEGFANLPDDATADDQQALVDEMVGLVRATVPLANMPALGPDATALLLTHQDARNNPAQRQVWSAVLQRLAVWRAEGADGEV